MQKCSLITLSVFLLIFCRANSVSVSHAEVGANFKAIPPFITSSAPPLVMLAMGRDHKLYYEAYNDASDLNDDGELDVLYKPNIDYYGYFDSYKCYTYSSSATTGASKFIPVAKTADKKCTDANDAYWSGDFLNYLTMSRMDTLRKVLYGGYRSQDDTSATVLERVYLPKDGHSWGKEYTSVDFDGYDIADYTPFTAPDALSGQRHLFASTTMTSTTSAPLLRYALYNPHRIWDWASAESTYLLEDSIVETSAVAYPGHPNNHDEFENLVLTFSQTQFYQGSKGWLDRTQRNKAYERYPSPTNTKFGAIDGAGNPIKNYTSYINYKANTNPTYNKAEQNYYLAIFTGTIHVDQGGTYTFGVDGDDTIEVIIDGGTANEKVVGYYGQHSANGVTNGIPINTVQVYFDPNSLHTIEFRMEESTGYDQYYLYWNGPDSGYSWKIVPNTAFTDLTLSTYLLETPKSEVKDLEVRVKVCDPTVGVESNCKQYPNGQYKPIGLLQQHGESKRMYFGLMTGSYTKNTSGGVLRKRISNISDEIISNTGQFKTTTNTAGFTNGIIQTINNFRITGFNYSSENYPAASPTNCGWITSGPMTEGQCRDWGNPIGEIIYEAERYFAGKKSATTAYKYTEGSTYDDDTKLGLPLATWNDPYDTSDVVDNKYPTTKGGFPSCSKPFLLVLSDINPSFDTDQLPGVDSNFGSGITSDLSGLNVKSLANKISDDESVNGKKFIGQSGNITDGVCTEKDILDNYGLGSVRGLCPEEPTKQGGYYSAAVAYYGHTNDLQPSVDGEQKVTTYAVGLASPLPRIELKVGADQKLITLVPFGKTVSEKSGSSNTGKWPYMPTNTIVDFYLEYLTPTFGKFRINFEDVEQGADHDMDAVVSYEYQLIDDSGEAVSDAKEATKVKVSLSSLSAAGSYIQHLGYVISGTTKDGPYLEVRDYDTSTAQDYRSAYDTLPDGASSTDKLPLTTSRIFTPSSKSGTAAQLLPNPLWYAAKWGGYNEKDTITGPNLQKEWDEDNDGIPDTYFYVTNPLRLEEQLNKSFASILNRASSGTAASVISNTRSGEGAVYQSIFFPERTDTTGSANTVNWVGQLHSFLVDAYGNMREDTNGNKKLDVLGPDLNDDGKVYNEDVNGNCVLDQQTTPTEDINGDGVLDDKDLITEDTNGNGKLDTESVGGVCTVGDTTYLSNLDAIIVFNKGKVDKYYDVNGNGILDPQEKLWSIGVKNIDTDNIHYLWNSSDWLNTISDSDIVQQRSFYISTEKKRHIFTWVDAVDSTTNARNGMVDSTEILNFIWPSATPAIDQLDDNDKFYAYLNLYPSFSSRPAAISNLLAASTTGFQEFLLKQSEREINWIRGLDYVNASGVPVPLTINGNQIAGSEMRSRRFNGKTWRLGDIAYSTPTTVGVPAEGYHLIYKDGSYEEFYRQYQKRRNVIYAGANDGMLHAFNGGFYDSFNKQFCRQLIAGYDPLDNSTANDDPCVPDSASTQPELGAELWAYVPYNLLPHLYWLTEKNYNHIYYVDQKPRIFDAKVFAPDAVHVNGWGTIMVVGMRFGGATITADLNKLDGIAPVATDPTMKSAFIIFDITNPEEKPTLLGEIQMPNMGFATCYPTMVVMRDGDHDGLFEDYNSTSPKTGENRWFLAFGSGPANASGEPDKAILNTAESSQNGRFYLLDMVQLVQNKKLMSLTDSGSKHGVLQAGLNTYFTLPATESQSFISDPITVDYDLDYNADALYFGTNSGDATNGWKGKMRRFIFDDKQNPEDWITDSILFNPGQPITAPASIAVDNIGRNWVFFGTGRYFVSADAVDVSTQSYYGIKEPIATSAPVDVTKRTWTTVDKSNLVNVTNYQIFTDDERTVNMGGASSWAGLLAEQNSKNGWYLNFLDTDSSGMKTIAKGERNLGQAALLGGILSFTTFIPSTDVCVAGGESYLWALYYQTGTAYYDSILGSITFDYNSKTLKMSLPRITLGEGLATSPNLHVGSKEGSTAFIQTSTGDIIRIEEKNPLDTKSGKASWKLR